MQKITFQLLTGIWGLLLAGLLYFFLLPLQLPAIAILLLTTALVAPVYRIFLRRLAPDASDKSLRRPAALLILAGSVMLMTRTAALQPVFQATMDSVRMWGYYARYLTLPEWRQLFTDNSGYPASHPPGLPAATAFLWRLLRTDSNLIPLALGYLSALLTVVILYLETYRTHFALAVFALLVFATDHPFIGRSLAQCADAPLALLLLCAAAALHHFRRTGRSGYITISAAFLGGCLWLKNEGLILALIFLAGYAGVFFGRRRTGHTLAGIGPFLAAWLAYKCCFAMPNETLRQPLREVLPHFADRHYYGIILLHFRTVLQQYFYVWEIAVAAYLLLCLVRKRWPARSILVLLAAMTGYLLLYFITPADLAWQLDTSLERILSQLVPAMAYCLIHAFARKPAMPGLIYDSSSSS